MAILTSEGVVARLRALFQRLLMGQVNAGTVTSGSWDQTTDANLAHARTTIHTLHIHDPQPPFTG